MEKQNNSNKEQQILEAAECEFINKGFDGARTTSIAKAAGVTHAMLHYYFRTKELLFEKIIDKKMSEITPLITYLLGDEKLPIVERVKDAISAHFDFIAANPDLPKFLMNEILPHKERCESFKKKINNVLLSFTAFQKEVDAASMRGEIEGFNVLLLFQSILSINVFSFISIPFIADVTGKDLNSYLNDRKNENIKLIMQRIKKIQ